MEILSKFYWSAVLTKLVETIISVKFWILCIATYLVFKLISIYIEMKDVIINAINTNNLDPTLIQILVNWSSSILDISLAMFTGVIVVITLSREVFKHAKISNSYKFGDENKHHKQKNNCCTDYQEEHFIKDNII
jgi:hypothetical protein